jgi:predicted Zn-dependent peptidase
VANRIVESARDNLTLNFLESYANGVGAVTQQQVSAAVAKYFDVDHLIIVVTGDRKVLEPALRAANVAPVVIVDANGKPTP